MFKKVHIIVVNIMIEKTCDDKFDVNFNEITEAFTEIKPVVAQVTTVAEFIGVIQSITEKIVFKYF